MARYISRRMLTGLLTVLFCLAFNFALIRLAPGDPIKIMAGIDNPNEEMIEITTALNEMSEHIILAVSNIKRHEAIARDEAIYVKRMENKVGDLTVQALEKLFDTADFRSIFKYREIYRHMNQTADIADEAMDCLLKILVKMS